MYPAHAVVAFTARSLTLATIAQTLARFVARVCAILSAFAALEGTLGT